jgi:hypothetical protein
VPGPSFCISVAWVVIGSLRRGPKSVFVKYKYLHKAQAFNDLQRLRAKPMRCSSGSPRKRTAPLNSVER